MPNRNVIPQKYQVWIDARQKYRLSHAQIQMARELGLNPKRFGKISYTRQEPWKAPLHAFIEELYFKRFGRARPPNVKSIEEIVNKGPEKKSGPQNAGHPSNDSNDKIG